MGENAGSKSLTFGSNPFNQRIYSTVNADDLPNGDSPPTPPERLPTHRIEHIALVTIHGRGHYFTAQCVVGDGECHGRISHP